MEITKQDKERFIQKLTTKPRRDRGRNETRFYNPTKDRCHQVDLMDLPNDKNFNHLLVVIDINTRKLDAIPLRGKTAQTVLNGIKKIYERDILDYPDQIEADNGSEFKGVFQTYFNSIGVLIKRNKPGRSRQQALVERANQTIAHKIFKIQLEKELETGKNSRLWIHLLKDIITEMNEKAQPSKVVYEEPVCEGSSCNVLEIGTKVLAMAEYPKDVEGKRLPGKFRKTDIKYELKIREIKELLIKENSPPLYLLNGNYGPLDIETVAYTKNQLLVLNPKEIKMLEIFQ
jgi:hypothetical protein